MYSWRESKFVYIYKKKTKDHKKSFHMKLFGTTEDADQGRLDRASSKLDNGYDASLNELSLAGPNQMSSLNERPWYFSNGVRYPKAVSRNRKTNKRNARLLPSETSRTDRISNQLMYVPANYETIKRKGKLKSILLYNGLGPWNVKAGRDVFLTSKCPVTTCSITSAREKAVSADLILYKDHYIPPAVPRSAHQIFMMYFLECPFHTQHVKFPDAFNWTATYRKDSDVVAPYEKWEYFDPRIRQIEQDRNYALNKTRKVAWFVSNCGARNGRLQYAHELQKHIQVDIYGACGTYKCSRTTAEKCFEILDRDYKFYLAFENSNCKDYITEKFFVNALNRNILPIVMGARPEDYEASSPQKSYIHVDEFASPKELAEYLNILDRNDELYNSYFKWKGTGEFINTYFWCRLCAMLHDESSFQKPKWYEDINDWWRGPGVCTNGSWRNFRARKDAISEE
ncbi:glycoprotein 3-alpha-L-fucosyltransferase A [Culex quinquefasciatus]|uniref:Fucosyltransferase n=1 Tax=Culex quinquefasciatus TaxID=7176 RepID=B0X104_CULQU|nr:glycoprotein 3-alpha-L-fucosyltransferase A [Culex quinquefasciatus]|eukprot:XP_001863326.1 glycoprotein 3-alpha-L-fucosyltransferase A [Culex quinquefasciatus]